MSKLFAGSAHEHWAAMEPGLRPFEAKLFEKYAPRKDISVLAVGCGNGRDAFGAFDAGYREVRGIDATPELISVAKTRNLDLKKAVRFVVGTADALPFPDNTFDIVTMFENLYGLITPRSARLAALSEARRVLRPGGLIFVVALPMYDRYRYAIWFFFAEAIRKVYNPFQLGRGDKLTQDAHTVAAAPQHLPRCHFFRPGELEREVAEAALEVVQATTIQGFLADPSASSTRHHKGERLVYVLRKNLNSSGPPDSPAGDPWNHRI
jgi:SAM-dependent methyltransferase